MELPAELRTKIVTTVEQQADLITSGYMTLEEYKAASGLIQGINLVLSIIENFQPEE